MKRQFNFYKRLVAVSTGRSDGRLGTNQGNARIFGWTGIDLAALDNRATSAGPQPPVPTSGNYDAGRAAARIDALEREAFGLRVTIARQRSPWVLGGFAMFVAGLDVVGWATSFEQVAVNRALGILAGFIAMGVTAVGVHALRAKSGGGLSPTAAEHVIRLVAGTVLLVVCGAAYRLRMAAMVGPDGDEAGVVQALSVILAIGCIALPGAAAVAVAAIGPAPRFRSELRLVERARQEAAAALESGLARSASNTHEESPEVHCARRLLSVYEAEFCTTAAAVERQNKELQP